MRCLHLPLTARLACPGLSFPFPRNLKMQQEAWKKHKKPPANKLQKPQFLTFTRKGQQATQWAKGCNCILHRPQYPRYGWREKGLSK